MISERRKFLNGKKKIKLLSKNFDLTCSFKQQSKLLTPFTTTALFLAYFTDKIQTTDLFKFKSRKAL